jgi:hypothetical protein
MAEFYWEDYVHNYEIDYYNDLTDDEKSIIMKKIGLPEYEHLGCYYKDYSGWNRRISGNTYYIKDMPWYAKLKDHLDKEFLAFMRKQKINKINETI